MYINLFSESDGDRIYGDVAIKICDDYTPQQVQDILDSWRKNLSDAELNSFDTIDKDKVQTVDQLIAILPAELQAEATDIHCADIFI